METQFRTAELCERLKVLGYAKRNRIRMYGEELELTSNPVPYENGYAIEAVSRSSGKAKRVRIPLSVLQMIQRDLKAKEARKAA